MVACFVPGNKEERVVYSIRTAAMRKRGMMEMGKGVEK